jgi:hypothetical protein
MTEPAGQIAAQLPQPEPCDDRCRLAGAIAGARALLAEPVAAGGLARRCGRLEAQLTMLAGHADAVLQALADFERGYRAGLARDG